MISFEPEFSEYLATEEDATVIHSFEIGVISGLLATTEYVAAVEQTAVTCGMRSIDDAARRVARVAARQAALFEGQRPPQVFVAVDESCLLQQVAEPAVMEQQLERLVEIASLPTVWLQIAPFSMGELRPFDRPISLLTMPDRSLVSYSESLLGGDLEQGNARVLSFLRSYHHLQAASLSPRDSISMINRVRKQAS
ncbi:DUF5753 domain-containing protein [Streptomyces sp. NPDC059578]|uniref:DUF5753 domain-containing protein n=1 Tax=Streptomyces sp. NPDC059578 TaxID=3346874 RepID=UPI0036A9CF10